MKANEQYKELKEFLMYHIRNNPKRTLDDILPQLNELFRNIGDTQIKKEKK